MESTWSLCGVYVELWSPCGVHENSMGQGKVHPMLINVTGS
jgi:hypothetical protein